MADASVLLPVGDWGGQDAIEEQRARAREIADRLDAGDEIEPENRLLVAHALRRWADSLPSKPKRPPGRAPRFNHAIEALTFVGHRLRGVSRAEALAEIAERCGITEGETVFSAIQKHLEAAVAYHRDVLGKDIPQGIFRKISL